MASSVDCRPKTRSNPPQLKPTGNGEVGSVYSAPLEENAVRNIHRNGNSVTATITSSASQATTRPGVGRRRWRAGPGGVAVGAGADGVRVAGIDMGDLSSGRSGRHG